MLLPRWKPGFRNRPRVGDILWDLLDNMEQQQNEYENIKWGAVRLIRDSDLLLSEYTLRCVLSQGREAGYWAYQSAGTMPSATTPARTGLILRIGAAGARYCRVLDQGIRSRSRSAHRTPGT